jgi:hypothetical protein
MQTRYMRLAEHFFDAAARFDREGNSSAAMLARANGAIFWAKAHPSDREAD